MKKYVAIILAALMIFTLTPSLAMAEEINTESDSAADKTLSEQLREGWDSLSTQIDVKGYGLTVNNAVEKYYNAILDNPDCFNVRMAPFEYYSNQETGEIVAIEPVYLTTDEDEYAAMKTKFDAALAEAKEAVNESGATTPLGKAYVLHNWLCTRATYNDDADDDYKNFTAYGTLAEGTGVCQSYTLAYAALLQAEDIDCAPLIVKECDHSWDEVKIGNAWYHVDVTNDDQNDPGDEAQAITYKYFLKSDKILQTDADHKGWKNGAYVESDKLSFGWNESLACTSTQFDNYGWTSFEADKVCADGHTFETVAGTAKSETCGTAGKKADQVCSFCGYVKEGEAISATGKHSLNSGVVTKKATATANGTITYTCKVCKKVIKTATIKKATILTAKAATKTVKYANSKKKAQTLTPITAKSGVGAKITYKIAKYGNNKAKKYLSLNAKTGKVTVKKGTPKGTYKITVKVSAAATTKYVAASKTVTVTIKVK